MTKNDITKRALMNAVGVVAYVTAFAFSVVNFENVFGPQPDGWFTVALFLTLFVLSASVTGSLVLLKPMQLYIDGQKKEAIHMFTYTLGFLAILALAISLAIGLT